jgi:very-short-patch-repair endonuclease
MSWRPIGLLINVTPIGHPGPMTNTYRRLLAVATGQLGLVSRRQANAVGLSNAQLRNRVSSGSLLQVGNDTFRFPGAPADAVAELRALMLDIGGDVWASGPTAAALHGFDGFRLRPPFDVLILRDRNVRRLGHRVHTTTSLDLIDRGVVDGLACTSAARTLIDLARTESVSRLTEALDSGLRDGRFSEASLHRRIVALRSKGRFGVPRLVEAIEGVEATRGAHSWLEREYLRLIDAARLPRPSTQQILTRAGDKVVRVDFRFEGTPVVVEVLGYHAHRSREHLQRDTERLNALLSDGFRPYQFTYAQVVEQPGDVVEQTSRALLPFLRSRR